MSLVPPLLRAYSPRCMQCAPQTLMTIQRHRKPSLRWITTNTTLAFEPSDIYISTSTSPLWNLSLEDLLFRKAPANRPLLLLYRNEPCVVIGRNQNPWKEINQTALKEANVPFIRRRSGGGTVYHDLGNTNFSLHLPRASFDRKKGSELAVRALKNLNVPDVWVNERNDVCVGKYKIGLLSCSAYKIINARAYHHGTMLLNARIDLLGDVLRNTKETMVGKSVPSVRSPVRNIVEFKSDITHEAFAAALCTAFSERFDTENKVVSVGEAILDDDRYMSEREFIQKSMTELESWEWKYGQTLEFTHTIKGIVNERSIHAEIVAKHGIITSCRLLADGNEVDSLNAALVGKRYGLLSEDEFDPILDDLAVVRWLQGEM